MAKRVTGWRKLAGVSWSAPSDPQFFGDLEIDAASLLSYIDRARRHTGVHVTVTHAVVRAVAHGLQQVPELNVRLAHGREYPRESIDILVIVSVDGNELTGIKVSSVDTKSLVDVAAEIEARAQAIRSGADAEFGRTKRMLTMLPPFLLRPALRLAARLTSDLNVDLPQFGLPRQAFGGAMVSSIGMTGIAHAYSPLAAYYRVPFLILVGAVEEKPAARAGQVVIRPMLSMTATFDHRYTDGFRAAAFGQAAREYLADPSAFEPRLPDRAVPRPRVASPA